MQFYFRTLHRRAWVARRGPAYAVAMLLVVTLVLGVIVVPAHAQAVDGTLNDIGTGESRVLSSGLTTLAPGQQITYQVAYDGNEQPISITMNAIPADSAIFQIWTDDRLEDLSEDADTQPLGQGTAMQEGSGFTNWQGGSPEAETYFVVVSATGNNTANFVLNVSSPGLSEDQPGAVVVAPVTPADPNVAVVTTDALNVRSGPSTAFPVLVTVPNGTQLTVLGRNAINTWINVELEDGTVGWVTRSLTSYDLVSPNVIAPPGSIGAAAGATVTGTVSGTVTNTTTTTGTAATGNTVAATPAISSTANLSATELSDSWQTLSEGDVDWYSFQYRGGDLPLTVWMDLEPFDDAEFVVVNAATAQELMAGTIITPTTVVGRGRANPVEPGYLYWQADFAEADTYYVMVQQTAAATGDVLYTIHALGPGVGRAIQPAE